MILPYLRSRHIARIDALILTHPHPDHVSGAATLIESMPVGQVIDNGEKPDDPLVIRYRDAAANRDVPVRRMRRGGTITIGDGVVIRVLGPPQRLIDTRVNNSSLVLRIEYGKTVLLLTGDIETKAELELLDNGQPLQCDLLKVAHHGSPSSSSEAFLKAVHPRFAVITVNANNRSGYPAPEVLDRLQRVGAQVFRTDRDGNVTCTSDGKRIQVTPQRGRLLPGE